MDGNYTPRSSGIQQRAEGETPKPPPLGYRKDPLRLPGTVASKGSPWCEATSPCLVKASQGEYTPGEGVRPRSWGQAGVQGSGVLAWDQRRVLELQQYRDAGTRHGGGGQPAAGADGSAASIYRAPWMQPSPARLHPIQRAQAAQAAAAAASGSGQQLRQPFDDSKDIADLSGQRRPWQRVYKALWQSGMDREASHFAYRLLHQGLNIGSHRLPGMIRSGDEDGIKGCLCPANTCIAPGFFGIDDVTWVTCIAPGLLETHLHAFWECPMVQPAVRWLWDLWQQLSGHAPPLNPAVLIVGDPSLWSPPPALCLLWLRLRATFLHTIWKLRHRRQVTNQALTSPVVVSATAASLERSIREDFLCATQDLPKQSGLGPRWFRGRARRQTLGDFQRKWCVRGVLASVHGNPPSLTVHVPTRIPP